MNGYHIVGDLLKALVSRGCAGARLSYNSLRFRSDTPHLCCACHWCSSSVTNSGRPQRCLHPRLLGDKLLGTKKVLFFFSCLYNVRIRTGFQAFSCTSSSKLELSLYFGAAPGHDGDASSRKKQTQQQQQQPNKTRTHTYKT